MALLRVGLNTGKKREELLQSYEGEEPYMPGGYETPYDGEEPYMPEGYDDEGYEDDYGTDGPYDDGYYDDEGYDGSRYDDDYGYDEAYGYDEDGYPVEGEEGYGPAPYYDAPEYVPDYPENGVGDLLYYVDEHEWINWVLLFLLPPLGIWLLWRRNRYSQNANILLTLLSLLWLLAVLVLVFVRPFRPQTDTTITPQPVGAAALPTEVPVETPEPEPVEAVVVTAEEVDDANAVFTVADKPYYHQSETCAFIGGAETKRIARNTAIEQSLLACPYCLASQYSDGLWDLVFVNAEMEDRSNMTVYCSAYNTFFHTDPDCSDLGTDGHEVGLKEALLMGKTACDKCCPSAAREVFCTVDGTYYHVDEFCSGMRNASKVTYAEARVTGKKRCPVCIGGTDETEEAAAEAEAQSGYYVYATPNGTYYHVNSTCSGMKDAQQVLLSTMLQQKRPACPVCCPDAEATVFAQSGNPYYHSYATCSGMTNATQGILVNALAAGLTRCPVCWTEGNGT